MDCEDIPLNISRETLQDSQVLRKLGEVVTKRALKHLKDVAKKRKILKRTIDGSKSADFS